MKSKTFLWAGRTGLLLFVATLLLAVCACTSVSTDPKSGVVTKTEFLPPAAFWETLGKLATRDAEPVPVVRAEK